MFHALYEAPQFSQCLPTFWDQYSVRYSAKRWDILTQTQDIKALPGYSLGSGITFISLAVGRPHLVNSAFPVLLPARKWTASAGSDH